MKKRGWLHRQLQNAAAVVQSLPDWMRLNNGTQHETGEEQEHSSPTASSKKEASPDKKSVRKNSQ